MGVNFNKVCIILRGVSGSSKSTFANYLETIIESKDDTSVAIVCTADDYFIQNGEYKFNASKLGYAHKYCRQKFEFACKNNADLVVLANTSTKESEFNPYLEIARNNGYTCFTIVMENREGTVNEHNVPEETLVRQQENIRGSLKLR